MTEIRLTEIKFTEPQLRALLWLPGDGSWSRKPREISAAVDSLCLYHPKLAETRSGPYAPRGGYITQAHLTEAGLIERAHRDSVE